MDPDNYAAHSMRADLLFNTGNYKEAVVNLSRVVDIQPDNHEAYVRRASSYAIMGKLEEALKDYEMAIDLLEFLADSSLAFPSDDYQINQHLIAINNAAYLAAYYGNQTTWCSLGISVLLRMNLFSQLVTGADPEFFYTESFSPQFIYLMMGHCYNSLDQNELARDKYRLATVPYKKASNHDYSAGVAFLFLGEYNKSIEMLNRCIDMNPPHIKHPYYFRGKALIHIGKIPEAFSDFATYLGLPPGTSENDILDKIKPELPEETFLLLKGQNGSY